MPSVGEAIEHGPLGKEAPEREAEALRFWPDMTVERARAPISQQFRQRDADGADALAGAAQRRSVGQIGRMIEAEEAGVSTEPIGPG